MKIHKKIGSKERLIEMFENVNKIKLVKLNETFDNPKDKDKKYLNKGGDEKAIDAQPNKYDDGTREPRERNIQVKDKSVEKLKGDDKPINEFFPGSGGAKSMIQHQYYQDEVEKEREQKEKQQKARERIDKRYFDRMNEPKPTSQDKPIDKPIDEPKPTSQDDMDSNGARYMKEKFVNLHRQGLGKSQQAKILDTQYHKMTGKHIWENNNLTEGELNELGWRDVKNVGAGIASAGKKVGQKIGQGVKGELGKMGQDVKQAGQWAKGKVQQGANKVGQGANKIGQAGQQVKQQYHKGSANRIINDIQQDAKKLGDTIAKFNAQAQKARQKPIPVQSILQTISNQLKGGGDINLQNRRFEGEDFGLDENIDDNPHSRDEMIAIILQDSDKYTPERLKTAPDEQINDIFNFVLSKGAGFPEKPESIPQDISKDDYNYGEDFDDEYSKFNEPSVQESSEEELDVDAVDIGNGEEELDIEIDNNGEEAIEGGLADGASPTDYDPKQILLGMEVEMEHTDDPKEALEIAMDHLEEDSEYYGTEGDDPEIEAQENAAEDAAEIADDVIGDELTDEEGVEELGDEEGVEDFGNTEDAPEKIEDDDLKVNMNWLETIKPKNVDDMDGLDEYDDFNPDLNPDDPNFNVGNTVNSDDPNSMIYHEVQSKFDSDSYERGTSPQNAYDSYMEYLEGERINRNNNPMKFIIWQGQQGFDDSERWSYE